jgi:hypothetical protein
MADTLYDTDFGLWIDDTVAKLRAGRYDEVDWENAIEELVAMGKSQRQALRRRLEGLLEHLLKRCYLANTYDNRGWELTIKEQRKEIGHLLEDSPSLRPYLQEILPRVWVEALADVRDRYPMAVLPDRYPFPSDIEALLQEVLWP